MGKGKKNEVEEGRNSVRLRDVAGLAALLLRPCDLPYRGMENEVKRGEKSFCPEQVDNQRERQCDKSEESSGPTANGKCNPALSFSFPLAPAPVLPRRLALSISPRYHTGKRPRSGHECWNPRRFMRIMPAEIRGRIKLKSNPDLRAQFSMF